MEEQHRHAEWTRSVGMQHGYAAWACSIVSQHEHAAFTVHERLKFSMDLQHGKAA
jgi:hypothetical protein